MIEMTATEEGSITEQSFHETVGLPIDIVTEAQSDNQAPIVAVSNLAQPIMINEQMQLTQTTEEDGTTSRAPAKRISNLTKQISALGDQEEDDLAFDEMIETQDQLEND